MDSTGVQAESPPTSPTLGSRVLVVEDDASLTDVLEYNLVQAGYEVSIARDGRAGLMMAQRDAPDLVVLDLMLPHVDGIEVCRSLRADPATRSTLVLMLTAKSEETDQVLGFGVGADDYVTKPFSISVLLQRIKALLRRRDQGDGDQDVSSSRGIIVDRRRHRATAGGCVLDLTPSEFKLLDVLLRQPGRAYSRNELIDAALGNDAIVLARTIDVHVRALRRKLGKYADLVETVRGIGYRFRDPGAG